MNGDTYMDVILADGVNSCLKVLINDAVGNFQTPVTLYTNRLPYFIFITDLNNDGWLDIIATNDYHSTISILLNMY